MKLVKLVKDLKRLANARLLSRALGIDFDAAADVNALRDQLEAKLPWLRRAEVLKEAARLKAENASKRAELAQVTAANAKLKADLAAVQTDLAAVQAGHATAEAALVAANTKAERKARELLAKMGVPLEPADATDNVKTEPRGLARAIKAFRNQK